MDVDVKPGSDDNPNNLNTMRGVVPLSILGTDDFDMSTLDASAVAFAGATVDKWLYEDVDSDIDLVLHFRQADTNLVEEDVDLVNEDLLDDTLDSSYYLCVAEITDVTVSSRKTLGSDVDNLLMSGRDLKELLASL